MSNIKLDDAVKMLTEAQCSKCSKRDAKVEVSDFRVVIKCGHCKRQLYIGSIKQPTAQFTLRKVAESDKW